MSADLFNPADPFDLIWITLMLLGIGIWLWIWLVKDPTR